MAKQLLIEDKMKEAELGFDGSWVVHPILVQPTLKCFSHVIMNAVN
jgi:malate synthase